MAKIEVALEAHSYDIELGSTGLETLGEFIKARVSPSSVVIITDSNVGPLYAEVARNSVESVGLSCSVLSFEAGEENKTTETLLTLWDGLLSAGVDRKSLVVALGGGVTGDLAGFAASSVLRGIDFIQVPTTLLACVDSSVGGKTGIDSSHGKNLIGAFYQPRGVLVDASTLKTLPVRELSAGLAEVIKTGVIASEELFAHVEENFEAILRAEGEPAATAIKHCCAIKADVVSRDEFDTTGLRAILNFGHTVGHAVELEEGLGEFLHGEGVAIGMVAAGRIAKKLGMFDAASCERMEKLIRNCNLPADLQNVSASNDVLINRMGHDKKTVGGKIYFVLPTRLGAAKLLDEPVSHKLIDEVLSSLR